jgi:hypothetical protein
LSDPKIVTIIPHDRSVEDPHFYLPKAYNEALAMVPDDWWVCVIDPDILLPPQDYWFRLLTEAINKEPGAGMFSAMTNRLMREKSGYQMVADNYEWNMDLQMHLWLGYEMATKIGCQLDDVTDIEIETKYRPTSGFFQAFRGDTWRMISPIEPPCRTVDWEIHRRIRRLGMRIYVIRGLYIFHYSHYDTDLLGIPSVVPGNKP